MKNNPTPTSTPVHGDARIWMFTGQGAPLAGSAQTLYEADPVFRQALEQHTGFLNAQLDVELLSLLLESGPAVASQLKQTQYAQPAMVALQLAQTAMWQARGLRPALVLGHSIGEFAAAAAVGVMSPEAALTLAVKRGRAMAACEPGAMAAVFVAANALPQLPDELVIAAENGPGLTVLAGPLAPLQQFVGEHFPNAHAMLQVSHAFHSPMMASAAAEFRQAVSEVDLASPRDAIFISTRTGLAETTLLQSADYWAGQIVAPVKFLGAVKSALERMPQPEQVLELGPDATLIGMAKRIAPGLKTDWIISAKAAPAAPATRLFRRTLLPWNRPASKATTAAGAMGKQAQASTAENCVYEIDWVPAAMSDANPATSMTAYPATSPAAIVSDAANTTAQADSGSSHLLLSFAPVPASLQGGLPDGWQYQQLAEGSNVADYVPLLASRAWETVALYGSGREVDVEVGLGLLQFFAAAAAVTVPATAPAAASAVQLAFITNGQQADDAGLWGLARTSRLEHPELAVRCIEAGSHHLPQALRLAVAHAGQGGETELALDAGNGVLRVPRLRLLASTSTASAQAGVAADAGQSETENVVNNATQNATQNAAKNTTQGAPAVFAARADASYVISGGQGALGQVVAEMLVAQGAKHILLLGRTPLAADSLSGPMLALRAQANVAYLSCDVAQLDSVNMVQSWLRTHDWPGVAGVVHAAGVLHDATLANQTADKLQQSYAVKVQGARHLRAVLQPRDFLLLFSSAAATFGSPGQASYAAANTALDALAREWGQANEAVLSIQWGAWSDAGMAQRNQAVKRAEQAGMGSISNQLGRAVLASLLARGKRGTVFVSPVDWHRVTLDMPLLAHVRRDQTSQTREGNLLTNALTNSLTNADTTKSAAHTVDDLYGIVRSAATEVIGEAVADDAPLLDSGLDSLGSVSLRNRLAAQLKLTLSSAFVMDYPDINSMVRFLASAAPQIASQSPAVTPVSSLPVLVIGAGIGGLSFARKLEKAGQPVVVMEAAAQAGGVWQTLANRSSKLQIDSPAYDFDSTALPMPGDHGWKASFPLQADIVAGCRDIAGELAGPVHFATRVQQVRKVGAQEYEVLYQGQQGQQVMRVSGVAAMTGGLHHSLNHIFPGEHQFAGHIGLGVANDTLPAQFANASVVIVGHGAFAVENMRTALENGAKHVTILCRRQHLVLSTFCNWLLNSSQGALPVSDVIEVMRPFYRACGTDVEDLPSLVRDKNGDLTLDQTTVPAGSDLYFLAQMLGKLSIVVDEPQDFSANAVLTRGGRTLPADVFLKCLGSNTDSTLIPTIFGADSQIQGLWINGDPNLITYNDGAQAPRQVKSLMCASYAFFVQSFVPAYLHFRQRPAEFAQALGRINNEAANSTNAERVLLELWDFVEPAKRIVAERTRERCPFDRFQIERENEWARYAQMLGADGATGRSLWQMLRPALALLHARNPQAPAETRQIHPALGAISVFVPRRRRVLFLPGQGTNARLARALLEQTGWIGRSGLDFVVPDAPYDMPAFTNEEQLRQIGLDGLVDSGMYDKNGRYREWRAGFEALFQRHQHGTPIIVTDAERQQWRTTLAYVRELATRHGPFDGIVGFCEGAAVASVALHLQANGEDLGLGELGFFIAMSPWRAPLYEIDGLFKPAQALAIPMLQIVGENDMPVFLAAAPLFRQDYRHAMEFRHGGQHVYPPFTPGLEHKLKQLLSRSDERGEPVPLAA